MIGMCVVVVCVKSDMFFVEEVVKCCWVFGVIVGERANSVEFEVLVNCVLELMKKLFLDEIVDIFWLFVIFWYLFECFFYEFDVYVVMIGFKGF